MVSKQGIEQKYFDVRSIVATSNMFERLFFKAEYFLSDRLKGIMPANFEPQIVLHLNADLWTVEEIYEILQ